MVIGSNLDMLPSLENHLPGPNGGLVDSLQGDLELNLRARHNHRMFDRERSLNMYRSGSAPPTVEGSLRAVGSLFRNPNFGDINSIGDVTSSNNVALAEDVIRLHPAYLSYYYSHDNINPRLPPPLLSKEDWRIAQRFQAGGLELGGIGDLRKKLVDSGDSSSLFSMQPALSMQKVENDSMDLRIANGSSHSRNTSAEWHDRGSDGLFGLQGSGLGARRKSFADILQEGLDPPASLSGHLSRPASRNAFGDVDATGMSDLHPSWLSDGVESLDRLHSGPSSADLVGGQSHNSTIAHSFASAVGSSLSRSTTPEQLLVVRSSGSGLPPVGTRVGPIEKKYAIGGTVQNDHSSGMTELGEIATALSDLNLPKIKHDTDSQKKGQIQLDLNNHPNFVASMSNGHKQNLQQQLSNSENLSFSTNYINVARNSGVMPNITASKMSANVEVSIPKRTSSSVNLHSKVNTPGIGHLERSNVYLQNVNNTSMDFTGQIPGAFSVHKKMNSGITNHLDAAVSGMRHGLDRLGNEAGAQLHQSSMVDPCYMQYLQGTADYATRASSSHPHVRNLYGFSQADLDGIQTAYLDILLAQQKQQYELSLGKSGGLHRGYFGNSSYGLGMPYSGSMGNPVIPSVGSRSSQKELVAHLSPDIRSSVGGSVGSNLEKRYTSSLLDEFKNNKTKSFELSDIIDHVVEFSMDQFGSRFIQQKLESATVEEKNKIFLEIVPHARALMTDVFGNYVMQKIFEHGTESQRKELASQLTGQVLPLSLQMYGCRVIQKALEVVDVDQQTQMVAELDGSVMKCVRDQNGNHVIQKCIECVPEDRIQFIISAFYGQVVALSTHPYGCRVIQRVLEHCRDPSTQQIIMDEIMLCICNLAQDQYGNYVIQHVLEHGKPHERSAIISLLAGQIVKMSQQKFASNVVEKCLTFGGPEERQLLVNEILGSTEENEPLQAMMKDPFGNYVVQKVLETCDDRSLELILSRIKVHLNALKRYTYGKHIVSRVEKLIATGERRIGLSSLST